MLKTIKTCFQCSRWDHYKSYKFIITGNYLMFTSSIFDSVSIIEKTIIERASQQTYKS